MINEEFTFLFTPTQSYLMVGWDALPIKAELHQNTKVNRVIGYVNPSGLFYAPDGMFKKVNLFYDSTELFKVNKMYDFNQEDFTYYFSEAVLKEQIIQTKYELKDYIDQAKIELL